MKKLMIPLMISIAFLVGCETAGVPVKTTSIEKIIMTDKAAEETFDLSMKWLNETFVSAKSVIQYNDKAVGMVTGKAIMSSRANLFRYFDIDYTLSIEVKENRARLSFNALDVYFVAAEGNNVGAKNALGQAEFDYFTSESGKIASQYEDYIKSHSSAW